MKAKIIPCIFLMLQIASQGWSQHSTDEYQFHSLEVELGLSNSNVLSIIKDRDGFMWFGTANGLNRFDGTHMKTFYSDDRDSTALSNSYISRIYAGPENTLWIKNVNGIFEVYQPETEQFERNIGRYADRYGLKDDPIHKLYQDGHRYWFIHQSGGVSLYDEEKGETIFLGQEPGDQANLSSDRVASVGKNSLGEYWVVHQNGLVDIVNGNDWSIFETLQLDLDIQSSEGYDFDLFIDSDQDAWIYSPEVALGVIHIDRKLSQISYFNERSQPFRLNNNLVKGIIEHRKGQIWICTDHGGINVLHKQKGTVDYVMHDPEQSRSLAHNAIYSLYKDSDDIIWIGTYKRGVNYYHPGLMSFSHVRKGYPGAASLPYNDVNVFVEDFLGNLYIGSNGDGLYYHDRQKGTYQRFVHDPDDPGSIPGNVIVDLAMDKEGYLWVGTYLNGLSRFDGKTFSRYMPETDNPNSLSDVNVWKIYVDRKNRIWVGTLRGGLNLWDREKDHFVRFPVGGETLPMNNQYISSFTEDMEGNLWVGGGYGIDVINVEKGYHRYHSTTLDSGLAGNNVTELFLDSKGLVWITTSQGLSYYDSKQEQFYSFSTEDGLPTNNLVSILEDEDRNFWLSTHSGLSYAAVDRTRTPLRLNFRNFDERDGLQGALFNKNAAYRTSDGNFIFGGPNGYNLFRSENFSFDLEEPEVVFTGFQLFNQPVGIGEEINGRVILDQAIAYKQEIILKHYENVFSIDFAALNFIQLEKNKFRYKLEGFNQEWIPISEAPFRVTYTNLDPGTYRLVVQAATHDGYWGQKPYSRTIVIQPPFWQTPLAYVLYALMAVLAVFYYRKHLIARERANFRRIEEQREARRIQELDKMKTRFFTNISHEFKTPLTLILTPIERLLKETEDPRQLRQYLTIQKNGKRLLQLVNQLLDIKNIEQDGLSFNPSEGDIISFIEDRANAFLDLSEKKRIRFSFYSTINSLQTQFDEDKLEKILFNLLSNAFKFTPNEGEIEVQVRWEEIEANRCALFIQVTDSGIGIQEQDLPRIFERYYTSDYQGKIANQGSGIGLALALEFARLHGGDITVGNAEPTGTKFCVRLELPLLSEFHLSATNGEEDHLSLKENQSGKPIILLVEDHEEFRNYLADCLSGEYHVVTAENGKEGIQKVMTSLPDLIITDMMMPQMDGVAFCQELKKDIRTSHVPVVMLTARNSEEKHLEGLESGCNLYLTKPFNLEILFSSIRNLLGERERLQAYYRKRLSVQASEQEIVSLDDKLIKKAVELVEANLDNPDFSVEQMSGELGMSRVHLYKKLSSLTGKSPVEFIRLIRIQRAAQLLGTSQLTVAEIAYKVGYNNAKYFSKHFKLEYGVLPSVYASQKGEVIES
jgi:signal transduction histidine kinase/ligand-binding sensor domain-containing protein/DNA-binding response OmpR family regulator